MAYPFPSHAGSHAGPYLVVPPQRSQSRHSHHRSHSHSSHHDQPVYMPPVVYTRSDSGHHHRHPSHSSHHSTHRHPSHSSHHVPHYPHPSQSHSHAYAHTPSYAVPVYQHPRERTPSIGDRVRQFFGMERSDHYDHRHHQPHYQPHHHSDDRRRRHNSFSGFRDDSGLHRNHSTRTGPWFFGAVDNRRYVDEHGRDIDHHGRVIHRY